MKLLPRAVYNDGTYFDLTEGADYGAIDRTKLASFCLLETIPDLEKLDASIANVDTLREEVTEEMRAEIAKAPDQEKQIEQVFQKVFNALEVLRYHRIDRKARALELWADMLRKRQTEREVFRLDLQEGQRLIWRKRVISGQYKDDQVWHLIGWQKTIKGENIQCIGYVNEEDGYVLMAGEWQGEHVLMGNVELLDFE
jgi:hypothetical protein